MGEWHFIAIRFRICYICNKGVVYMKRFLSALLILVLILSFGACKAEEEKPQNSTPVETDSQDETSSEEELVKPAEYFEEKSHNGIDFLFHKPVRKTDKKYPLIIFLHGLNDKVYKNDLGIASTLVLSLIKYENLSDDYSAYTLIPTTPESGWWQPNQLEAFKEIMFTIIENNNVDPKRVYISGVSMGGFTLCDLIDELPPNTFAAAIPMSGCGMLQSPEKHLNTAFRMYHNAGDTIVNESCSVNLNQQLLDAGHKNTAFERFYYGDHGTTVNIVFAGQANTFFPWLFQQRLP